MLHFSYYLPLLRLVAQETYTEPIKVTPAVRLRDLMVLTKLRLGTLVVISAILGYLMAKDFIWSDFLLLVFGGFLVTGSANGFNQILEREYDKLMKRTQSRPLVRGTMQPMEAFWISLLIGFAGLVMLYFINFRSAFLGLSSLLLYVLVYTPSKRFTPWAVFIGAFPGAFPVMLGYVAATGEFGILPGMLFFVQFMWQFPHFWAIAWVLDDDYKKAGYHLLPSRFGRNKASSFQILLFTVALIAASAAPWIMNIIGDVAFIFSMVAGLWFYRIALRLHYSQDIKDARKLMFASFLYLPIIQILYVLDKL